MSPALNKLAPMLLTRPLLLVFLAFLASAANLYPSQFGGFRAPLSQRVAPAVACEQQVSVELDYGQMRRPGSRRRARCV